MPALGVGKLGFHPDLPLAHRRLVGRGRVIAAHLLKVVGMEGAVDRAAVRAGSALRFDRAAVAGHSVSSVEALLPRCIWSYVTARAVPVGTGTHRDEHRK